MNITKLASAPLKNKNSKLVVFIDRSSFTHDVQWVLAVLAKALFFEGNTNLLLCSFDLTKLLYLGDQLYPLKSLFPTV